MKNKLIITLLALTMTTAMLAGCGKETAEVQTADTEAVAEVSTEAKTVVAETETEESTEGAELVLNTETTEKAEVAATGDKNTGTNKKSDTKSETKKTESTKTDSKDAGTKTETKADSTKNDSATQAPAETTTNTPAQTPAETPAPEPEPEAPAQNLCPYGPFDQWLDLGNGWWGYYTCFQSPDGTRSALDKEFTDVIMTSDSTWTYDDWSTELLGTYDDAKDVILTKYHMVPITN